MHMKVWLTLLRVKTHMLDTEAAIKKLLIHPLSEQFVVQNFRNKIIVILYRQDKIMCPWAEIMTCWAILFNFKLKIRFSSPSNTNELHLRLVRPTV